LEQQITIGVGGNDAPRQTGETGDGWVRSGLDAEHCRPALMIAPDKTNLLVHEGF